MSRQPFRTFLAAIFITLTAMTRTTCGQDGVVLRSEVERLQTEYNALLEVADRQEEWLSEVRAFAQELPQQRETARSLTQQLNRLEQIEQTLRVWATASLVLGNQRTSGAAALRETESGYQIVATATHPFQKYAIAAAMQGRVPCRAEASSARLLEQVLSEASGHSALPVLASDQLNDGIAGIMALRPVTESGLQFMVFHDPVSGDQKVAAIHSTAEGHSIDTMDSAMKQLAESAFSGGSVWTGNQEKIEPHIEIGDPFVDYCTLAIVHSLGHDVHQRRNVCVSIRVNLDSSLVSTSSENPHRRAKRYLKNEAETDIVLALGRQLHDQFYTRMIRRNIPVIEREHEEALREEDSASGYGAITSHLAQATHTLVIDVDKGPDGADRVAVRLSDVASSQSIWAANDSRSVVPNRNWKNYILHSGVPAIVECLSESSKAQVEALLQAEGLTTTRRAKKHILINEGQFGDAFRLRTLYGLRTIEIPIADAGMTPIVLAPGQRIQSDSENTTGKQNLHYAAWRLARHVAPPAVRLPASSDSGSPRSRILPLGSSNHVTGGNRFRLLCPSPQSRSWKLLPGVAVLSEVLDANSSRVLLPGNQTMPTPEMNDVVAVCDSWEQQKVAVMTPVVPLGMSLSAKKHHDRKSKGYTFGAAFQKSLIETLASRIDCTAGIWECNPRVGDYWDMGIERAKTLAGLQRQGITHIICGELESVSETHTEVHIGLIKLDRDPNGELVEGPVIDSVRVLLAKSDL